MEAAHSDLRLGILLLSLLVSSLRILILGILWAILRLLLSSRLLLRMQASVARCTIPDTVDGCILRHRSIQQCDVRSRGIIVASFAASS